MRSAIAAAAAAGVCLGGCAVGGGVGYSHASIGGRKDPRAGFVEDGKASGGTAYEEFRLVDTTGLLLAALTNAGRAYNARAEAAERAQYDTPDDHGVVHFTYSYEPMPIISGLLTDMRIRLGLGSPNIELPPGMETTRAIDYWEFDLRSEFYTFRPIKRLPLVSAVYLGALFGKWGAADMDFISFDPFIVDMPFGVSSTYLINPNLAVTGRVAVGALSPLLGLISGGGLFNPSAEVEVGWRPLQTGKVGVQLSANASIQREFAVDRSIVEPRVSINAMFTIGDQRRKDRAPEPTGETAAPAPAPSSAPDANGQVSGNVCGGSSPDPSCKTLGDTLPENAKILLSACVIATQNAGKSLQFDNQPGACRTAGDGLANQARAATDPAQKTRLHAAAVVAYDLAGAGYEIGAGGKRYTLDQCAMIEQTHNQLNPDDGAPRPFPTKGASLDLAITTCREQYSCTLDPATHAIGCTVKETAPAPAPAPAPGGIGGATSATPPATP